MGSDTVTFGVGFRNSGGAAAKGTVKVNGVVQAPAAVAATTAIGFNYKALGG